MSEKYSFGAMLDLSRNAVMRVEQVKRFIDVIAKMGYNALYLYTEDTYEIDGEPYFGRSRGRYSKAELKEIGAYGNEKGVEVVPCIQTLAHLNGIFRWNEYRKIRDTGPILLVENERTYELIERMFATMRECFDTENINIGMDEAHSVGLGRYLDEHGFTDRFALLSRHLKRVLEIAAKYGFKPTMWSDMFIRMIHGGNYYPKNPDWEQIEARKGEIPEGVKLCYWDYDHEDKSVYDTVFEIHERFGRETTFAGGAYSWQGFVPRARASLRCILPAMRSCREHGIKTVLITMWGDDGKECSFFSMLPHLLYAIEVYRGNEDMDSIKKKFFEIVGLGWDEFMDIELPNRIGKNLYGNPSKYLLYSDLFMGFADWHIKDKPDFEAYARRLSAIAKKSGEYGYLFEVARELCRVLAVKFDLGVNTRKAYIGKDTATLKKIADNDYPSYIKRLEKFYETFKALWMKENKPHGFDVQDIRFGGLLQRAKHCRETLLAYLSGKVDIIEELEESVLPVAECDDLSFREPRYHRVVSGNILSHGLNF